MRRKRRGIGPKGIQSIAWGREKGYTIHSCKVGAGVAKDIETIRVISDYVPASESIIFDPNRSWLMIEALQIMNSITESVLDFEQPYHSYEECLQVRRQTRHPIVLDESIQCYGDVIRAHRDQARTSPRKDCNSPNSLLTCILTA